MYMEVTMIIGIVAVIVGIGCGIIVFHAKFLPRDIRFIRGMQMALTAGLVVLAWFIKNDIVNTAIDLLIIASGIDMFGAYKSLIHKIK